MYRCQRCGGVVTATAKEDNQEVSDFYPSTFAVDDCIPERPRSYLGQAIISLHAPAGAVMLAASAVDAMLKVKGYKEGSLYNRIDKAAADHIITEDMAKWAHQVRLDANEQRHADEEVPIPGQDDAYRSIEFASALGQFMFVLPALIEKGLKESVRTENQ